MLHFVKMIIYGTSVVIWLHTILVGSC